MTNKSRSLQKALEQRNVTMVTPSRERDRSRASSTFCFKISSRINQSKLFHNKKNIACYDNSHAQSSVCTIILGMTILHAQYFA